MTGSPGIDPGDLEPRQTADPLCTAGLGSGGMWSSGRSRPAESAAEPTRVLHSGPVWKLGKTWSVSSRVRLWRERYLVLRSDRAELYKCDREWQCGGIPLKVLPLRRARVLEGGEQDAGKYVFHLEETDALRSHIFAVNSAGLRGKWLSALSSLHATGDAGQAPELATALVKEDPEQDGNTCPTSRAATAETGYHAAAETASARRPLENPVAQAPPDIALPITHGILASAVAAHAQLGAAAASALSDDSQSARSLSPLAEKDNETLAKFAQRWKLEAERVTAWAIAAQAATDKKNEQMEAQLTKLRAQLARARFLEDDAHKSSQEKAAAYEQELHALKAQLATNNDEVAKMRVEAAKKDADLVAKGEALEALDVENKRIHLELESAKRVTESKRAEHHLVRSKTVASVDVDVQTEEKGNQTLTFLLTPTTQHSSSPTATPTSSASSDQETEEWDGETQRKQVGQRLRGLRVRQAIISARTQMMLSLVGAWWFSPTFQSRIRQQRIYFHKLRYWSVFAHKETELEVEHGKRMQLEKEVHSLRAMQNSSQAMRMALAESQKVLQNVKQVDTNTLASKSREDLIKQNSQLKLECARFEKEAARAWQDARDYISRIKTELEASQSQG